ncbi:hypothetical protein GH714_020147 [Hevea brasiliensis]|uniref:Rx N-terminal domain-containing protein n=1 Tax=Hevea brasiliensis TaxID=3981 RepID=A0A6A6LNB1_HEVBR|nr:hypothetical protein GH714_020147 [Hevea brasiliensis]
MAFAVISMILERLSSFALSGLEQEARLVMDVEREIQKLKYNLESIQVVLDDADVRQRKEASVKLWLHRLKDISFDIDDVLDEWSTAIYKSQIEPSQEAPEPKRKIKELNERLDDIAKEKDRYNFSFRKSTEELERQITASVIDVAEDCQSNPRITQGPETNSVELQTLLQQMQQSIKGQRFLLVLDDVWTEDARKWENLMHSFKCGERGSRILITTRKENVATRIGCTDTPNRTIVHGGIGQCLVKLHFLETTSIECERVEDIGRKIVKKCKGLPLAAKTLGGLLRFRKFREEWQSVLDSEVWELEEAEKDFRCSMVELL